MSLNTGSANQAPLFSMWPRQGSAYLTGGNASLSGTPLPAFVISAGNQGSLVTRIEANAASITQSSVIRVSICDTAGLTAMTWREYPMGIVSATVTSTGWWTADTNFGNYALPSGYTIRALLATAGPSAWVRVSVEDF